MKTDESRFTTELQIISLSIGQATSHGDYFYGRWQSGRHLFDVIHSNRGTLRIDMSGRVNTWPVMDIRIGKRKYKSACHDGNSLHAEVPIKPGQEITVQWGLTQGEFPEFYSYRFAIDP